MLTLYAFNRRITMDSDTVAEAFARHTLIVLQGRAEEALLPGHVAIDREHRVCLLQPITPQEMYLAEYRRAPRHAIAKEVLPFAQCSYKPDKFLIKSIQRIAEKIPLNECFQKPFWL